MHIGSFLLSTIILITENMLLHGKRFSYSEDMMFCFVFSTICKATCSNYSFGKLRNRMVVIPVLFRERGAQKTMQRARDQQSGHTPGSELKIKSKESRDEHRFA